MGTLLIFIGAGLGGISRYWLSYAIYQLLGRSFPFGTLIVNVSGCFLVGLLFILSVDRFGHIGPQFRSLLLIGFLGGYTTFSTFSLETVNLFENGAWLSGGLNIFLSLFLCLIATWFGIFCGRQV